MNIAALEDRARTDAPASFGYDTLEEEQRMNERRERCIQMVAVQIEAEIREVIAGKRSSIRMWNGRMTAADFLTEVLDELDEDAPKVLLLGASDDCKSVNDIITDFARDEAEFRVEQMPDSQLPEC